MIELPAAVVEGVEPKAGNRQNPAVRTDSVYVLVTSIDETLVAVRAARSFADAMGVPVTVVHLRAVPFALPVDQPTGISPVETEAFMARLQAEGANARVRVHLCRDTRRAIPFAFRPHSLIMMGGRHGWWPTRSERSRRALEAAGHFVVLVDTSDASTRREAVPSPQVDEPEEAFRA